MLTKFKLVLVISSVALLSACGGGSGGTVAPSGPVASVNAFNIKAGYTALVVGGFTTTLTISGSCSGTFTLTTGRANTAATFEAVTGFSGVSVGGFSFTNCTPASVFSTTTNYYDSNYMPLGSSSTDLYGKYLTPPIIPTAAHVGDVGLVGTKTYYTNSTKTTGDGREDTSYVMEADTATTAIINLISKAYNQAGTLLVTEQDRYRVAADGTLTLFAIDFQFANGSRTHLVGN